MNAILLSAGFGTRFQPYTNSTAKPTIPFLNLPLIAYSIYYANKWGCNDLVVNTHHLPETIKNCCDSLQPKIKGQLKLINESPTILDSGGGIKNAENYLEKDDYFLVFNTDIPHVLPEINFYEIIKQHKDSNSLVTFLSCDLENLGTKIRGLWTKQESQKVLDIGLGPKDKLTCKHYTGIMLVSKKLLSLQPENKPHNIIYDVILPAIKDGHTVSTYHLNSFKWFETGNLNSYLDASFTVLDQLINQPESSFSLELNNIFKKFELNNQVHSSNHCNILYKNELPIGLGDIDISGSIIFGDALKLNNLKTLCDSVIYSEADNATQSFNRQLFL